MWPPTNGILQRRSHDWRLMQTFSLVGLLSQQWHQHPQIPLVGGHMISTKILRPEPEPKRPLKALWTIVINGYVTGESSKFNSLWNGLYAQVYLFHNASFTKTFQISFSHIFHFKVNRQFSSGKGDDSVAVDIISHLMEVMRWDVCIKTY